MLQLSSMLNILIQLADLNAQAKDVIKGWKDLFDEATEAVVGRQ